MTVSFPDHLSLLAFLLDRRPQIVDDIEKHLLNVQGKATSRNRNRVDGDRTIRRCLFETAGLPRALSALNGQLLAAHVADGFEPVMLEQRSHQLDGVELLHRAYDHWDRHRWPAGMAVSHSPTRCIPYRKGNSSPQVGRAANRRRRGKSVRALARMGSTGPRPNRLRITEAGPA